MDTIKCRSPFATFMLYGLDSAQPPWACPFSERLANCLTGFFVEGSDGYRGYCREPQVTEVTTRQPGSPEIKAPGQGFDTRNDGHGDYQEASVVPG